MKVWLSKITLAMFLGAATLAKHVPIPAGKRFLRFAICLAIFATVGFSAAYAAGSNDTVAVVDFSVPAEASNTWAWARGGMADLLQVELDQRGLVTLDRSFIQAVLSERRMAVGGLTSSDCKSIATLLGAKYLVTGKVTPLEAGKCRIEASAFSVETIETVAAGVGEGTLPKELPQILRTVANALAPVLMKDHSVKPAVRGAKGRSPDPEALIAYYKGLDAYTAGYPEIAAAWFLDSVGLDAGFAPAQLWEIKAYRAAGLEADARIREKEIAGVLKRLGIGEEKSNEVSGVEARSVALMKPSVVPLEGHAPTVDVGLLTASLRQGALGVTDVRVFEPGNIAASLVEQDRLLNGLFSAEGGIQYGQWSMVGALLFCRAHEEPDDKVSLMLSLCNPVSFEVEAEDRITVNRAEIGQSVQTCCTRVVQLWRDQRLLLKNGRSASEAPPRAEDRHAGERKQPYEIVCFSMDVVAGERERLAELPDVHRGLAFALMGLYRRAEGCDNTWGARDIAINAYTKLKRYPQAAEAFLEKLKAIDCEKPDAPLKLHRIAWCYDGLSYTDDFLWPWMRTWEHRNRPMELLLTRFPDTIWAAGAQLWLASKHWKAGNLPKAATYAYGSRRGLSKTIVALSEHPNANKQVQKAIVGAINDLRRAIVTDFYIEADAAASLGRTNDVLKIVNEVEAFIREHNVPTDLPGQLIALDLWLEVLSGSTGFVGSFAGRPNWTQDRRPGCYSRALIASVARTNTTSQTGLAEAEEILDVLKAGLQSPVDADKAVERLIAMYKTVRNDSELAEKLLPVVEKGLSFYVTATGANRQRPELARGRLEEMSQAILAGNDAVFDPQVPAPVQDRMKSSAVEVISLYEQCGLGKEWLATLDPCFKAPYPVDVGIALLLRGNMTAKGCKEKMECLVSRMPETRQCLPFTIWMKYANCLVAEQRYGEALATYRQAFPNGWPRTCFELNKFVILNRGTKENSTRLDEMAKQACGAACVGIDDPFCPVGLLLSLLDAALEQRADHVEDALARQFREFGVVPVDPVAAIWFEIGRARQEARQFSKAATCYRHVLVVLAPPVVEEESWLWHVSFPWGHEAIQQRVYGVNATYSLRTRSIRLAARYWLAKCLIETGEVDEAAELLRGLARDYGDETASILLRSVECGNGSSVRVNVGTESLALLEKLHAQAQPLPAKDVTTSTGKTTNATGDAKQGR